MSKSKKPTVLRNLNIKSVSVVDQGANQHAHIKLAKRADEEAPEVNTEEKPVENDTAFFARLGQAVAKMFRMNPRETEEVEKEARSFATIDGTRKTYERIYRISDALGDSLRSIVSDEELNDEQKAAMIVETADQAAKAIKTDIAAMFNGTAAVTKGEADDNGEKGVGETPNPEAPATDPAPESNPAENTAAENPVAESNIEKGETDMKFNMEAMTPEERAQLEDLQKRFGVEEEAPAAPAAAPADQNEGAGDGDVFKGLHPAVKAEIESLRKFREETEERELMEIAKRYTIIGKKPEELAPVLKSLKAAGGTAFADMIAMLDSTKETVEKSGVFGEIGKRGNVASNADDAWGRIEAAADEILKSNANITRAQAIEKACDVHPDLVAEYENSRK